MDLPLWVRVVQEVAHYSAVVPLAVCGYLALRKREPSPDAWLLSAAFFVSFIADQVMAYMAAHATPNWWISYIYAPLQFGLFAAVVAPARSLRVVTVGSILLLALVSATRGTLGHPETMVQVIGGGLVALLVFEQNDMTLYRPALLVYCLGCAPFLLAMGAFELAAAGPWLMAWVAYQCVRVLALALMVRALMTRPRLRLEVASGPGMGTAAAGRRAAHWFGAGNRADPVAAPTKRQAS